jgi:hypothetical protein
MKLSLIVCTIASVEAFQQGAYHQSVRVRVSHTPLYQVQESSSIDRRQVFHSLAIPSMAFLVMSFPSESVLAAAAATSSEAKKGPTPEELSRIQQGYLSVTNLLNNFEKETTVCRENGGECKRDADAVRRVLGLRSTKDPLFQIEKVFAKVKYMDDIDFDQLEIFFQATEDWNTAVNMSNSMAFISQFGEYNPGGGKDEVQKYLEESRKQVVLAQQALKDILTVLKLSE